VWCTSLATERLATRTPFNEKALEKAVQSTKEGPAFEVAWRQLGATQYNLKQWVQAVISFDRAQELGKAAAAKKKKRHANLKRGLLRSFT